jgi:hypothetical protein
MMSRDDAVYTLTALAMLALAAFARWHEFFGCVRDYSLLVCIPR